jgi:hypothetical protein
MGLETVILSGTGSGKEKWTAGRINRIVAKASEMGFM